KSGGMIPPHPPGFRPHAQAREAERSALAAIAPPCGAPQQRQNEPHSGDGGVGGAALHVFEKAFRYYLERNLV
ncbi:MAG: hypothetical protein ABSE08_20090, partial [Syntrophobacteraceae bacterium]